MIQKHIYTNNNLPDIIDSYIQELVSLGDIKSFNHANKLRSYKNIISDSKFLDELHDMFVETYRLLGSIDPRLCFHLEGRQKSLISTEKKIIRYQSLEKSLDLINDLVAFRIILWGDEDIDLIKFCYVLTEKIIDFFASKGFSACVASPLIGVKNLKPHNEFNGKFKYKDLIKDYICYPKPNEYQSIHITFIDSDGKKFEVQIRTSEMDSIADDDDHKIYKAKVDKDVDLPLERDKIKIPGYHNADTDFVGLEKSKSIFPR